MSSCYRLLLMFLMHTDGRVRSVAGTESGNAMTLGHQDVADVGARIGQNGAKTVHEAPQAGLQKMAELQAIGNQHPTVCCECRLPIVGRDTTDHVYDLAAELDVRRDFHHQP